ncbi:MAG: [protein-PII] uridylyltransferase [Geminicoccaceae bacterium]|nr:MAG: [protein-PII] uridylyltransferase [Geminicoccaceae bacterium]
MSSSLSLPHLPTSPAVAGASEHDALGLREALSALAFDARPLEVARPRLRAAEAGIQRVFESDGTATEVVFNRARTIDALLGGLLDWADRTRYPLPNPTQAEGLAVVAVGGYGRAELAPHSDVDLLFLHGYKPSARIEQLVETVLYTLWDLGLKVGHAVRSVDDALRAARNDTTIMTAALETRLIWGNAPIYDGFVRRLGPEVVQGRELAFLDEKLAERGQRHSKAGDSRHLLEPNVKEGEGGLRDLQLIMWLGRCFHGAATVEELLTHDLLDRSGLRSYRIAERFLWAVRCHLHYLTGRDEERLAFDLQTEVAQRMGFKARHRLESVERFMKRFHIVAKDVGILTSIVAGTLDERSRKRARFNLKSFGFGRQRFAGFTVEDGKIAPDEPERFQRRPADMLELFVIADRNGVKPRASALAAIRRSLKRVTPEVRDDATAIAHLVHLITAAQRPGQTLAAMNDVGALGRFVPEFGRIVGQMQHNLYHIYTVDEHTLRVVGQLDAIADGQYAEELPLATEVMQQIVSKPDLYLAALFHDIGKGRRGNHATVGEQIAYKVMTRWKLPAPQIETVMWLVRHHLLMSQTAFSRDLEDAKTIQDFVQLVQSPERLRLLLLLTVADIRGVGPHVWNGWKAQLLRSLFRAAESAMLAGDVDAARRAAAEDAKGRLATALRTAPPMGWAQTEIDAYLARHDARYWLGFEPSQHVAHAKLIAEVEAAGDVSGLNLTVDLFRDRTELTLYAPDHPGLFMEVAGALALAGASIVDAHIFTTQDSMALDSFGIQDADRQGAVDDPRRLAKIKETVADAIAGRIHLAKVLAGRRPKPSRKDVFQVTPRVLIDNGASRTHTVVELNGRDRPGLLFDVTSALKDLGLVVSSAHITTFGERAVDVIYLKDVFGMKVTSPGKLQKLRAALLQALEPEARIGHGPGTKAG